MDHPMDMEANKETAALERSLSTVTYWYFVVPACHAPYQSRPTINVRPRVAAAARAGTTCACARRTATRRRASFDAIDDARFGHAEEFRCLDVRARRLFVRRTRLLCRKCGASLGFGYDDRAASPRYDIKICRLQPLVDAHDAPVSAAA